MKKIIKFLILILLLSASNAFPQEMKGSFGFFSGVSLNTNSYQIETSNYPDTSYSNDIKPAFNLGMFVMYDFVKNFGLKLQGQYTNKGGITSVQAYYSADITPIDRTYRNTINYLQFSLLPQLNLPFNQKTSKSKAYFDVGGYLSVKLSASESIDYETFSQQMSLQKDISNSLTGTDAGLIFAVGIVYKAFLLDIRYDLGLTNIADNPNFKDALSIKNRSINFSIGWTGGGF